MSEIEVRPVLIGRSLSGKTASDETGVSARDIGSKAAQLRLMSRLGLRVPPAFVLPTALCGPVNRSDEDALRQVRDALTMGIRFLEQETGRVFGDPRQPLLVSVRSGAERSMPGMMDTVLNVGLNEAAVYGLMRLYGDPRLAWDSLRRLQQGYGEVVAGIGAGVFEERLAVLVAEEGVAADADLDSESLERLALDYRRAMQGIGKPLPVDPAEQLERAALAVYRSWEAPKAREYRRLNHFEDLTGTAVTVQAMVFGNAGGASGAGVAFSRDPATGAPGVYADFLFDAQGEDVVSGRRLPGDLSLLERRLPHVARELVAGIAQLEAAQKDMQDVEFTVEEGVLYFLQTRAAKRTPRAALKVAVDLVEAKTLTPAEGRALLAGVDLDKIVLTRFAGEEAPAATGIPASPGTVAGRAAFDSETATRLAGQHEPVILIRHDIATDDVAGIAAASGTLTAAGNRTAHAAVVARQLGRACVVGCRALGFAEKDGRTSVTIGDHTVSSGDWLSIDGSSGAVYLGRREVVTVRPEAELAIVAGWGA
ncbi:PEP/pyruvate-binding domain-containing protein [Pseudochelatococcus lubricantis]|uniref:PEP/pyruvate-binding domain-containing protein n=1 Tax=Pseudochelatococcus lubricantis TaxID=1538102 RepID=UPI0035E607A1